ncbi:glutamyl-tRNA reductase [Longimicrobium sp.]|uniref:glutamyl-tRNA reductase n=1 Tax=Longimicrobium sp. TaxID=2029185 RepID=UPI002E35D8F9|nr:glutamyl-tRNA reductase [Longimicrobium sp.]HEX6038458.1 glutamyl-tRNA reductase [Longimicrobium sp.]
MPLAVVGASHRTAPIELRERFAFGRTEIPGALVELSADGSEAVILSTCNRTEVYLALPDGSDGVEHARALLSARIGAEGNEAARYFYVHRDRQAAEHLFRVSSGLDSMILGEPQIQGQVKEAYATAREVASDDGPVVGQALHRLFQTAFSIGGRVRSDTGLGIGAASVSSVAVDLTKKIFGSLKGRRALVLGAGEMSEVTMECLRAEGVRTAIVANRTYERARELAERLGGEAIHWEEFGRALPEVDIVICSTAAPHPVLTVDRLRSALPSGPRRPLCIIDIAIPRDVEAAVGDVENVFLYNVDDLQGIVDANLGRRRAQLPAAESIVLGGVDDFWAWYSSLAVVPTIRALRDRGEALRQAEVERALRSLSHLSPEDQLAIDALTRALVNKVLHAPTARLRQAAGNGRGTGVLDTVRYLFELDAGPHEPGAD